MRFYLFLIGFSFFYFQTARPLVAQTAPKITWDRTLGGNQSDVPYFGFQTKDGGYFMGGYSESSVSGHKSQPSQGNHDFWIIKTDANGHKLWDRTYGGQRDEELNAGKQTIDGGFIVAGRTDSNVGGDRTQPLKGVDDIWILKLDSAGNKVWDKTLGGYGSENVYGMEQTQDGGYILTGSSSSGIGGDKSEPHRGNGDGWVIKLDANGNKIWDKTYGGTRQDLLFCVLQTSDGNFLLGGKSNSEINPDKSEASKGYLDFWVLKIDPNGKIIWDRTLGGDLEEDLLAMQETLDGGYVLGGRSGSNAGGDKSEANLGNSDFWVVKIDGVGNKLWDKTYGGPKSDVLISLDKTTDGGFILAGSSESELSADKSENSKGGNDFWILKVDEQGGILWDKTLGGSGYELPFFVAQTHDGGFIVGGETYSNLSGDKTEANLGISDFWLVKLAPELHSKKEPDLKIFPNPSRGEFKVQIAGIGDAEAELTVYDFLGRKYFTKTVQVKNSGITEKIKLAISTGIYFVQIRNGQWVITQKIVVE